MRRSDVLSALAATTLALSRRPAGAQTLEKIVVSGPIAESQTDLFYAVKNGMFTHAGLDVSIVSTSSGSASTTAVITGTHELGITNVLPIFSAYLRGIPVAMIAPGIINTAEHPYAQLQVATDSPYKTGADLKGKTAASPALGDINSLATHAWIDKNGGDSKSMKFVEVPNIAIEEALVAHRIDTAMLQSPLLDASLQAGRTRSLGYAYGAIANIFMGTGYVGRRDWADAHASVARRFAKTLEDASTYVMAHPAETAALVSEYTKITLENTQRMHRTQNGLSLDASLIQPVIDVAARYGTITRAFPAREIVWT
jgi:NitT/TauT family transport system substrate-binding protein